MADDVTFQSNVLATPAVGIVVAADEIAGAVHQRMKITVGADGANDGDVSIATPLPVNDSCVNIEGAGKVAIGVASVEMTFTGTVRAIILTADLANTGILYVGNIGVTSAGANAFAFLEAGDVLTLDIDADGCMVHVVASIAAQNVWKGALL